MCGRAVRMEGNVTARLCGCDARARMTLSEISARQSVDVSDFVSYLDDEYLQNDDDGTDLPLPDLESLHPSEEFSTAVAPSCQPATTSKTQITSDSELTDPEFGDGIGLESDAKEPDSNSTASETSETDLEASDASQIKAQKGRRRRRPAGRKRNRNRAQTSIGNGLDPSQQHGASRERDAFGHTDASINEVSTSLPSEISAEPDGTTDSSPPRETAGDAASGPRNRRRRRRRGQRKRSRSDGPSGSDSAEDTTP